MRVLLLCLVFAMSGVMFSVHAGDVYTFNIADIDGAIGEVHTTTVDIEIDGTAIDAWQFAICHDPDELQLTPIVDGDDDGVVSLDLGEPAFEGITIGEVDGSWAAGAVIDFEGGTLAAGGDAYDCNYKLLTTNTSDLTFCDTELDADGISVAVDGVATAVTTNDGTVTSSNPFSFVLRNAESDLAGDQTASINFAALNTGTGGANAFSVSIVYDDLMLAGVGAEETTELEDINPTFFSATVDPGGTAGITVGCVIHFTDFDVTIDFADEDDLIQFNFDIIGADCDTDPPEEGETTAVTFEDIGSVVNEVVVGVISTTPAFDETTNEIPIACETPGDFLRGDCDGNGVTFPILDALFLLEYGFVNGPVPPCLSAGDCDGNGIVFPILDALFLLEYGFVNGPTPPDPGPDECGPQTTDPDPGCETPPVC